MGTPLRVVVLEDVEDDALLLLTELRRGGYTPDWARVDTLAALEDTLARGAWDVVLADYSLPHCSADEALVIVRRRDPDLPFLVVTGVANEEEAVALLKAGAQDYLAKDRLVRLVPAVAREVREATGRRARRRAEAALRASEAHHRAIVDTAFDAIVTVDADGRLVSLNRGAERIFGYPASAVVGQPLALLLPAAPDLGAVCAPDRTCEVAGRRRDGTPVPLEFSVTEIRPAPGPLFAAILRDVTERRDFETRLAHQAFHDALTGLPNRALFLDRLGHALARSDRHRRAVAVLFLDLDRFKVVNDSLGHEAGDRLLVATASRLRACLRPSDTLARFGGDEFTVLLEDIGGARDAAAVAERITAALGGAMTIGDQELVVTASIGIALGTAGSVVPGDLLRHADIALYRAKGEGKARYAVFDTAMHEQARARLALEGDLRRALAQGELELHYQPQVSLATGQIVGVEALARWQHPARGMIAPAQFLPLAEEIGLMVPLGQWVLAAACRQAQEWRARWQAAAELRLAVNLSAPEFREPHLVARVAEVLTRTGFPPHLLELELTESALLGDAPATADTLRALRRLGVRLALDDFGTGYSSLSYLRRFRADTLKIDRSFVAGLATTPEQQAIVAAIGALAHALGLGVTAEGVETAEQVERLRSLGCDLGQGYYFARPLPPEGMGPLLTAARPGPAPG